MRIALITCEDLPDWEVDDAPLRDALVAAGAQLSEPVWSDPAVDWSRFDLAVLRTTWDYQDRLPEFLEWAERAARATRLEHGAEVVLWNTVKTYLRDLAGQGHRIAPTTWLDAGDAPDVASIMAARGWDAGFLKPWVGATAKDTLRFRADPAGLAAAADHLAAHLPSTGFILQPYLSSVEREGELSLLFLGGSFSHGVRKVPVPGDYRVQDDFGAHDEPWTPTAAEVELGESILASAAGLLGRTIPFLYGRVDFLRDDEGHLCLNELELVEPSLFFRHGPGAAQRFAAALLSGAESVRP